MARAAGGVSKTRWTYDVVAQAYLERKRERPWDGNLLDLLTAYALGFQIRVRRRRHCGVGHAERFTTADVPHTPRNGVGGAC